MNTSLASKIRDFIYGKDRAITEDDLCEVAERNRMSRYLSWLAYDRERKYYILSDETFGFIWECIPLCFAGEKTTSTIEAVFHMGLPPGSVLQIILYADPYINPILESYFSTKVRARDSQVLGRVYEKYLQFFEQGKTGMANFSRMPLRNYRLFVTLKIPKEKVTDTQLFDFYNNVRELLAGTSLYPIDVPPELFLEWMRGFFNDRRPLNIMNYDDSRFIRDQIISSETVITNNFRHLQVGDRYFRSLTVKTYPSEVDPFQTNEIFGGVWGQTSDSSQMLTPYMFTMNVIFDDLKASIHAKTNLILQQQALGSFAPAIMRRKEEFLRAADEIEKGTQFVRIMPILWVWAASEEAVTESAMRARRLWEANGYIMQEDRAILPVLFIASLPFCLYTRKKVIEALDRSFVVPAYVASRVLPLQADFRGGGDPQLIFCGRKGQVCGIDLFSKAANNHNCFIAAGSGAGKSFLINYITSNYYAATALIRIIDIGGSYRKMTHLYNARYLDFTSEANICLNPFTRIDPTDPSGDLQVIAALVWQMCYSATSTVSQDIAEITMSLIKLAVNWAWSEYGNDADIDKVYEYLSTFPEYYDVGQHSKSELMKFVEISKELSINLQDFTSNGLYGRWFNGPSNFDISTDEFVVLELENLKPQKDLFRVVTMQVINAVTYDLYLSDRSRKRLIIFDEAWQFIRDGSSIKDVIEEGYRRARKYGGSFTVVTQSILDIRQFGSVGDVILANSAFKLFLQSTDFDRAKSQGLIDYDDFVMALLKSMASKRPYYSEIFIDSPFGAGVVRLSVDPHSYYLYTSDASEIAEIEERVRLGDTYAEAIDYMVSKYRS